MDSQPTIKLEPFTEADIERLMGRVPSAEFLRQWSGSLFSYPLDREQIQRHLAGIIDQPPSVIFTRPSTKPPVK